MDRVGAGSAFHLRVDPLRWSAHYGRGGADREGDLIRGVDLEPHDVRGVTREVRGELCRFQQLVPRHRHLGRVTGRDDLAVVRELTLDDPGDEFRLFCVEDDLAAVRRDEDVDRLVGGIDAVFELDVGTCRPVELDRRRCHREKLFPTEPCLSE